MSWTESVQSPLIIKTGDGRSFSPLWKNSCSKEIEYNIAQFDFPKIKGSKIDRGTPMARKFNLEIYFQGDNSFDDANAFETSAEDPRPWTISHPIYGSILVQPVGLKIDYSAFNAVQVTGTLLETLGSPGLQITIVPVDKINADKQAVDETQATAFNAVQDTLKSRELNASDLNAAVKEITQLKGINKTLYDIAVKQVKITEDAGTYLNLFNAANASVDQILFAPIPAIQAIQAFVNFPAMMITSVQVRLSVMQSQLSSLNQQISNLTTKTQKKIYELIGGVLVSAIAQASVTSYDQNNQLVINGQMPDYTTRVDVLNAIAILMAANGGFVGTLDGIQTTNGGLEDSYMPDADSIGQIQDLINFTISNLSVIALSAKQERTIVLENDSNVIILTHRFYGLLTDDSTIDTFIKSNNIFLNELLQIKKGRTIVYYV